MMIEGSNSPGNSGRPSDETMVNMPNPSVEQSAGAPEPISTAPGEVPQPSVTIEAPTTSFGQENPPTLTNIPIPTEADLTASLASVPQPVESSSAVTAVGLKTEMLTVPVAPVVEPLAESQPGTYVEHKAQVMAIPPEAKLANIEKMAASEPGFAEALKKAQADAEANQWIYGLGSEQAPLEDVTLADAAIRSLYSDGGEASWIKVAGQVVKVDAANRRATIYQSFTDAQEQAKAPGFDWEAIAKLKREASIIATKPSTTESRLELVKPQ